MTWTIAGTGPLAEVLDSLASSPIPTHLVSDESPSGIAAQQHYSKALDAVIATLRACTSSHATVNLTESYAGELAVTSTDEMCTIVLPTP